MKYEEVLLELYSAREIIKLLQEERNTKTDSVTHDLNQGSEYNHSGFKPDNWTNVSNSRRNRSNKQHKHVIQPIPTITNRFASLPNLNENNAGVDISEDTTRRIGVKKQKVQQSTQGKMMDPSKSSSTTTACKDTLDKHNKKVGNKRNHKIVIIGDSHSRGLAKEVKHQLDKNFEVIGFVKPGAGTEKIVKSGMSDIAKLTKSDVVVFCGGSYEVNKNMAKIALNQIISFVETNNHTNFIILSAPHRHDLVDFSCVNNEIKSFNRKLKKQVKISKYTMVLEINPTRELFTKHGLHLNGKGKEMIAKQIVAQLPNILGKKDDGVISLGWKNGQIKGESIDALGNRTQSPEKRNSNFIHEETIISEVTPPRTSNRRKKVPVIRNNDFLW
ncbi:hypothetical protein B7P43_G09959 [Cryptotermes secundus]|uniref:Uncharacterized protein n=1 Tax=Cryptotermes secundus TaxID=105785 RepID=A0A2J7QPT2_9NEOP|nr:hypothetical protein B7P43_G09959 [Cryptotermes secundus]